MTGKISRRQRDLIFKMMAVFLSVPGAFVSDGNEPLTETETTVFNSAPVYRTPSTASFRKGPGEKRMENSGGLYYIVDMAFFVKTDPERSKAYRALGTNILIDEALLTDKGGRKK